MSFTRAVLAAFVGGVLAIVFVLAWKASQESGKSIVESLPDVPREAQKISSDVRTRTTGAVNAGLDTVRKTEAAVKDRFVRHGEEVEGAEGAEDI